MNSSSIWKRTLPLILVLVLIIGIAVSCTLLSNKKTAPSISNPDEAYLSRENLLIKNKDAYEVLKNKYGYSITLDLIDKHLLQNANGKNYLEAVTKEDIAQAFKDKYGNVDDVPEDQKEKYLQSIYDNIYFNTGFKSQAEIDESIRLELARKLYAKDKVIEESKTEDDYFKDSDYNTQLKNNYKSDVSAIVIPYYTQYELEIALKQFGVKLKSDKTKWVKTVKDDPKADGDELTLEEIKRVFIDLYNSAFSHEAKTVNGIVLQEDEHFKVVDGKITFIHNDFDHDSRLVFTQKEIDKLGLGTLLYDDLKLITEDPKEKAFTVKYDKQYGGKYYLVLKIDQAPKNELTTIIKDNITIKDEITEKFIKDKLTNEKISKEISKLRREHNLTIYDPYISLNYTFQDADFKETKKSSKNIIATIDGFELKADVLFDRLDTLFGPSFVTEKLLLNYLLNSQFNDFYDIKNNKFLTKEAKTKYNDEFANLKLRVKQDYAQYASFITMEEYLLSTYNVRTLDELKYQLFYRDIVEEYRKDFADVEDNWETYEKLMQDILKKFFEVKGIHMLIYVNDPVKNSPVDPEKWTEYQVQLAKELTTLIKDTLKKEVTGSKTYSSILTKIQEDFNNAPRLVAGFDVDSDEARPLYDKEAQYQEVDYTYSKFKSAGLLLKFEDLGTITPGKMVKPFEEAVKYMWDVNEEAGHHNDNIARLYDKPASEYLETEFGFHILVATNTIGYKYANQDEKALPTKDEVLKFFDVKAVKDLSEAVKTAINTNFMPLYNERKGVADSNGEMQANLTDLELLNKIKEVVQKLDIAGEKIDNIVYYIDAKYRVTKDSLNFKE